MFRNTLTFNYRYPIRDCENFTHPPPPHPTPPRFKCNYLLNEKLFFILWFHFQKLHQIVNILKKIMIFIATLFRKLQTVKDLVRPLSTKHRFRTPIDSQHLKGSQTLVKSSSEPFHHIFSSL